MSAIIGPEPNWEAVRLDVGSGMTYREIGAKHGVSAATVCKRAKKEDWPRDLSHRIKERTERNILAAETAKHRNTKAGVSRPVSYANERDMIESEAAARSAVVMQDREDSAVPVRVAQGMLRELLALQDENLRDILITAGEKALKDGSPEERKAIQKALDAAMSLPGRAGVAQKLTAAYVQAAEFRRKAYNIDKDVEPGEDPWKQMIDWITRNNKPHVSVQVNNVSPVVSASPFVREVK